jgi:hypothetical protein
MKHLIASTTLAALVLAGCRETPKPIVLPPAPPSFSVPANRAEASAALVDRNAHLIADIAQFPGNNAGEHLAILVPTLDDLSKALQLANGPVQSPEFANRIAVIDSAYATASLVDLPRSRMEAVENQALLATSAALQEIKTRYLYDDDQLPPMLDTVGGDVTAAAASVGPLHDTDATHAFRSIEIAIQRISDDMTERFNVGTPLAPPPPAP